MKRNKKDDVAQIRAAKKDVKRMNKMQGVVEFGQEASSLSNSQDDSEEEDAPFWFDPMIPVGERFEEFRQECIQNNKKKAKPEPSSSSESSINDGDDSDIRDRKKAFLRRKRDKEKEKEKEKERVKKKQQEMGESKDIQLEGIVDPSAIDQTKDEYFKLIA